MDALQKELTDHSPETAAKVFRVRFDDAHDVSELASQKRAEFAATIEHLRDLSLGKTWITENIPTIKQLPTEPQR